MVMEVQKETNHDAKTKKDFIESLVNHPLAGTVIDIATCYWDDAAGASKKNRLSAFDNNEEEFLKVKMTLSKQGISKLHTEYLVSFNEESLPVPAVWVRRGEGSSHKLKDAVLVTGQMRKNRIVLGCKKQETKI
jgi:hypothetical protein